MTPVGAQLLAAVQSWPQRSGVLVSDLLHVEAPLRVALMRVVRRGSTTLEELSGDLGVPVEDADAIAAALVDRGACDRAVDRGLRRRPARVRPRSESALLDPIDGGDR